MKKTFLVLLFAGSLGLHSCNSNQKQQEYVSEESNNVFAEASAPENALKYTPPTVAPDEEVVNSENSKEEYNVNKPISNKSKIIKDGSFTIKTYDIKTSKNGMDGILKKLRAYYELEDFQNNSQTMAFNLKIRVPAENFEKLIAGLENGQDEIQRKNIQARDVTEEFVDIESRLANKRDYLKRYKELLSKASTVKDILAIEENIRTLQEEIESREGRLKYLNDQVSFSTLEIYLFQEKEFVFKPEQEDKFSERVKKSLNNGWISVVEFVLWIITSWPFLLLGVIGFFVGRQLIKRRKSKKADGV